MYLKKIITTGLISLIGVAGMCISVAPQAHLGGGVNISVGVESVSAQNGTQVVSNNPPASAGGGAQGSQPPASKTQEMYTSIVNFINMALGIITALVSPVVLFVSWLMTPDWTSGDLFNLRIPMYKIWVVVSNIVYFIYAVMLIIIALATMFNQEKFSYKVMLPRLALGIIMVPFTWWFVQWTVALSTYVTASAISIPLETVGQINPPWYSDPKFASIPRNITVDTRVTTTQTQPKTCKENRANCMTPKEFLSSGGGIYGPLVVYAYSVFRVNEVPTLDTKVDVIKAAVQLINQSVLSVIMLIVFGLLVMALAAILIVRAVKLWVYAIFSPLFTFRFVANQQIGGDKDDNFSLKEFVGLAFVPAVIAIILSFGLIIISSVSSTSKSDGTAGTDKAPPCNLTTGCRVTLFDDPNTYIERKNDISQNPPVTQTILKYSGVTVTFLGAGSNQSDANEDMSTGVINSLSNLFGTIITQLMAIVFIWMAFMAAKGVNKAVAGAVEPFEKIGTSIAGLAKSLPKYTPIPGTGGLRVGTVDKFVGGIQGAIDSKADADFKNSTAGQWVQSLSGGKITIDPRDIQKLSDALNQSSGEDALRGMQRTLSDIVSKGQGAGIYRDSAAASKIDTLASRVKAGDVSEAHLITVFGQGPGRRLFELLKDGGYKNDMEVTAALLSGWQRGSTGRITTSKSSAEQYLTSATPSNNPETPPQTPPPPGHVSIAGNPIKIDNRTDQKKIEEALQSLKNKATEGEVRDGLRSAGVASDMIDKVVSGLGGSFFKAPPTP